MKQPRSTIRSPYMEWAKLCSAAPYNLATSGMAEYPLAQLGPDLPQLEINDSSPYGYPPLRERLARKSQAPPQCVVMAAGTSLANHLAMAACFEPGEEVLVEQPTYELLLSTARFLGAKIRRFRRRFEDGFRIDPEEVEKRVTPRTRLIVITNLHNPSSALTDEPTLAAVGEIAGVRRVRFTTSHPRDFGRDIVEAIDAVSTLCDHVHLPVQSGSDAVLDAMQRLYTREQYLERIAWIQAARREISITSDMIVGFPGETEADFEQTLSLLDEVEYDSIFCFKYSPRPNTPSLQLEDAIPEAEKSRRLIILQEKQREIQRRRYQRHVGQIQEIMVEGKNEARRQWIGRTSQNKTLNFTVPQEVVPEVGSYIPVLTTGSFPNSLLGEMVI